VPRALTRRSFLLALAAESADRPDLPDALLVEAYGKAAMQNVLAAVNPSVFPGYWSVCADGRGFGYGNTYPSLDGHQMTDALLWLGRVETALANWTYVRGFQREDGALPLAILPGQAGKTIGPKDHSAAVDANGGLYRHWVPGNPLAALAGPTYIQNADAIFRRTLDRDWLGAQIVSVNRAADFLATLVRPDGLVRGGGYYVERPARLECDGVTQPHAVDAFGRAAALNRIAGRVRDARRYQQLAARIRRAFLSRFWVRDHFAEYLDPRRGLVDRHGLSDTNWAALALDVVEPTRRGALWERLRSEPRFYYGGMPTGIAADPASYEAWEFSYPDRMDMAAMGRVWYLEALARARMRDADGLLDSILRVCRAGRDAGYFWRERYGPRGGYGAERYCEYPANLIRIVQRCLFGIDLGLDGEVAIAPVAPDGFWERGFGESLAWRGRLLRFRLQRERASGDYRGSGPQSLSVRFRNGRVRRVQLPASPGEPRAWSLG
jgi:hypothetical protein